MKKERKKERESENCGILSQEAVTDTNQQNVYNYVLYITCRTLNIIYM